MSHDIYLLRAPKCNGISYKQIKLIQLYLDWMQQCRKSNQYGSNSFEKWCGSHIEELISPEEIAFYKPFFERECISSNDINGYRCCGIFEQMQRIPKASHLLCWIMRHVINTSELPFEEVVEVTREQLEDFLETLNRTRRYAITPVCSTLDCKISEYSVNKGVAETMFPVMEREGEAMSPFEYNSLYACQIISCLRALVEILSTTNFERQTIYFHLARLYR